jgi:hypothetical protein
MNDGNLDETTTNISNHHASSISFCWFSITARISTLKSETLTVSNGKAPLRILMSLLLLRRRRSFISGGSVTLRPFDATGSSGRLEFPGIA